jgi:hypothetical protein
MNDVDGKEIKVGSIVRPVGHFDYVGRCEVTELTPKGVRAVRFFDESDVWFHAESVRVLA